MTEPVPAPGQPAVPPPTERLAERIPTDRPGASPLIRALRELAEVDRAVYRAVAQTPTPSLDRPLQRLTEAADHSKLWLAGAAAMAVVGGRTGRRAAATGVAAIALTSFVVNVPMKLAGARRRPDRDAAGVPQARWVDMPTSPSFPSGHSASAAAFASAASSVIPALGAPLGCAAALIGYTRVHAGVHYPGDVVAGVIVGAAVGEVVATAGRGIVRRRAARARAEPRRTMWTR